MNEKWIAIDWGTTNFRAFLVNYHKIEDRLSAPLGLLQVTDRQFAATLQSLLSGWLTQHGSLPILMAGMVGSQQGWADVPYVTLPAHAGDFATHTVEVATPWGSRCHIVAGATCESEWGFPDVMRGEEVQLLGLAELHPAAAHRVILPGTHSKHARLCDGKLINFSTFMTGELYATLINHSLLGKDVPVSPQDDAAFDLGVANSKKSPFLSHAVFSARTLRLRGAITPAQVSSYLSGLLLGSELAALDADNAWVVGSASLALNYQRAARQFGISLQVADGSACFVQGLSQIYDSGVFA